MSATWIRSSVSEGPARDPGTRRRCQGKKVVAITSNFHPSLRASDCVLAPVVGPRKHQHILHRDDDQDRPDEKRDDAVHLEPNKPVTRHRSQRLALGIEGRVTDIAVDDANCTECQPGAPVAGWPVSRLKLPESSVMVAAANTPSNRAETVCVILKMLRPEPIHPVVRATWSQVGCWRTVTL